MQQRLDCWVDAPQHQQVLEHHQHQHQHQQLPGEAVGAILLLRSTWLASSSAALPQTLHVHTPMHTSPQTSITARAPVDNRHILRTPNAPYASIIAPHTHALPRSPNIHVEQPLSVLLPVVLPALTASTSGFRRRCTTNRSATRHLPNASPRGARARRTRPAGDLRLLGLLRPWPGHILRLLRQADVRGLYTRV